MPDWTHRKANMMKQYKATLRLKRGSASTDEIEGDLVEIADDVPKPSDVLPWLALTVSVVSIVFTAFQASETRDNNRIAVMPRLLVSRFGIARDSIGVFIENDGTGPAVIKAVDLYFRDQKQRSIGDLRGSITTALKMRTAQLPYVEVENEYFYRAGQRVDVLSEGVNKNTLTDEQRSSVWRTLDDDVNIAVEYCSVYDECRHACLHQNDPRCLAAD